VERFAQLARVVSRPGRVRGRREQVRLEDRHAKRGERIAIVRDCPGTLGGIRRHQPWGKRTRVHQRRVDDGPDVPLEGTHVVGGVVAVGFTRLREQIDHQHPHSAAGCESRAHSLAQQAGDHARVEAPGTEHHEVGVGDGVQRLGRCRHGASQPQAVHAPASGSDGGLAAHHTTVREIRDQIDAPPRCREDASLRSEEPRRFLDCRGETAQPLRESGKDQVPDGMAPDPADSREPMLEDPRERICAGRERHQAVADVARARKPIEAAQLARASAVVAGRHDCGNLWRHVKSARADQPAEDRGEPGSSADGRDSQRPANRKRLR
jgi:hypothetical protein